MRKRLQAAGVLPIGGRKKMRKLIKVLLISLLVLTLVACGGTGDKDKDNDTTDGKKYEVGVVIYQFNDNFMT